MNKKKILSLFFVLLTASCSQFTALYKTQGAATTAPEVIPSPIMTDQPTLAPHVCTVATGYQTGALNLRSGAGVNYAVIHVLNEGEVLQVIQAGEWLKVKTTQHVTGWVNSEFCKE